MSYQYPAIIFLIPFLTAICMPVVCRKKRDWCRPIALAAVFAMSAAALANLLDVLQDGETRHVFGGWLSSAATAGVPIGIEWVNDGLAIIMVGLSVGGDDGWVRQSPSPRECAGA